VPIKTLHLTNAFHPASGGIRTFYLAMLAAANAERRYMRLVVPSDVSSVEEEGEYGRIYHVRAPRSPWVDKRYRLILPQMFLSRRGEVRRILAEEQPDLIEVCDKYSLCYAAGALRRGWLDGVRRPTIVGLSCERLDDNVRASMSAGALAKHFARWYIGRIYTGQFDVHLANSEYTARELREHQAPKHPRDVHVVPMGVTLDELGPDKKSAELRAELHRLTGSNSEATLLLYAGRLSPEKNLPLLIDMMERIGAAPARAAGNGNGNGNGNGIDDTRLIVAGDGPSLAALREDAERRAPGRVFFYGHVGARETLARLYASCDVFVHPNPREPFGRPARSHGVRRAAGGAVRGWIAVVCQRHERLAGRAHGRGVCPRRARRLSAGAGSRRPRGACARDRGRLCLGQRDAHDLRALRSAPRLLWVDIPPEREDSRVRRRPKEPHACRPEIVETTSLRARSRHISSSKPRR
jgi:alpha-1,6-mannosyltransferase